MTKRKALEDLKVRRFPKIYPGRRFGKLTVIAECEAPDSSGRKTKSYEKFYFCQCECGEATVGQITKLNTGEKRSCGCLLGETTAQRNLTHGANARGRRSKAYNTWAHVLQRCRNPKNVSYPDYGGRGIKVCDRWADSFENFLADMGEPPSPEHSIDRIDYNGNYEPGNCRWEVKIVQMNNKRSNRRITFGGRTQTLAEWAREKSLLPDTISNRIKAGWSVESAVNTPKVK